MMTDKRGDHRLPDKVAVIVRGWLNCNQILLADGDAHVLIDSGYHTHAAETLALLQANCTRVSRLINTHCHSDHIGGNAAVAERYGCPITVSALEAPNLDPWDEAAFWMSYADQYAPRFHFADTLSPGDRFSAAGTEWQAVAAPGHAMGALLFYSPELGLLLSGDALWRHGLGAIMPHDGENAALEAALATLDSIEKLGVAMVIPGHGEPFREVPEAIAEARSRLLAFKADVRRNARNFMKVMFTFSLLAKRSMEKRIALDYIDRVPVYRDLNRRFVGLPDSELAPALLEELQRVGAIAVQDNVITPRMAA
jgi:glyoxylase-like metal-dependent hydrolase (beta-lactamase superfamily II)